MKQIEKYFESHRDLWAATLLFTMFMGAYLIGSLMMFLNR